MREDPVLPGDSFSQRMKVVTSMKLRRILVAVLALCLLLPGCATQDEPVKDTWSGILATTTTTEPTQLTSPWEELLTYSEYLEMSAQERSDFENSFADSGEFFQWLKAVKEIYELERKENELGHSGNIDMGEINPGG